MLEVARSTVCFLRTIWYCLHLLNRLFNMHCIGFQLRTLLPLLTTALSRSKDRGLTKVVAGRQVRQPVFHASSAACLLCRLAVSVRAPAKLFLGFRPAEADFSCFCAEITRDTNVPLRGSLPSSQLSCSGIPLDMMLVGLEDICPGKASVLTTICPGARRHPS